MRKKCWKIITLLLALVTALSLVGCTFSSGDENGTVDNGGSVTGLVAPTVLPDSVAQSSGIVFAEDTEARSGSPLSLTEAAAKVKGSCVMITSTSDSESGAGSGVIVDVNDGKSNDDTIFYILTCAHVCKENAEVKIYLPDENFRYNENEDYVFSGVIGGKKKDVQNNAVTLVGADKESDVAVLRLNIAGSKLTADDITEAKVIPNGYGVTYGEQVFAIGNPSGSLPGTISTGIISYVNRQITVDSIGAMTLLQLDMTTHPGSSGGALFNMYGELIGITNSGDTEYVGLNFAIPHKISVDEGKIDNGFVNIAKQLLGTAVANEFNNYGYVSGREVKLGVTVTQENGNVVVASLTEDGWAQENGIYVNDKITNVKLYKNGGDELTEEKNISLLSDFSEMMEKTTIGDKLVITLKRYMQSGMRIYETTVTKEFTKTQYYFCDTGVYPQQ